jgi:pseudouridine kinase
MITEREQQVLDLVRASPLISQHAIAEELGISRSAVAGHIMNLTSKGIIKGRGYVISDAPFVAVIGGANMDIHGSPGARLRKHDSNPGTVHTSPGGVARNIAENLARLGADCRLIAPVGNDHHGQLLMKQGDAAGIDMQNMLQFDAANTSTYLSVLDDCGDMFVGISDMSILDLLNAERLRTHEKMLQQASLVIADTNLTDNALGYITRTCADQTLFVDTVSTTKALRIKPYLDAVHTLKPSLIEAEELAGIRAPTNKELPGLAAWFHERGVRRLFVTLGARGVFYSTQDAQGIEASANSLEHPVNAGGAGDAFVAGLAYAWLKQWPLLKSVRFAIATATLALTDAATINPNMSATAVQKIYEQNHAET